MKCKEEKIWLKWGGDRAGEQDLGGWESGTYRRGQRVSVLDLLHTRAPGVETNFISLRFKAI